MAGKFSLEEQQQHMDHFYGDYVAAAAKVNQRKPEFNSIQPKCQLLLLARLLTCFLACMLDADDRKRPKNNPIERIRLKENSENHQPVQCTPNPTQPEPELKMLLPLSHTIDHCKILLLLLLHHSLQFGHIGHIASWTSNDQTLVYRGHWWMEEEARGPSKQQARAEESESSLFVCFSRSLARYQFGPNPRKTMLTNTHRECHLVQIFVCVCAP